VRAYDDLISRESDADRWESIRRHRPTYLVASQDAKPFCAACRVPLTGLSWAMEECSGYPRRIETTT
jgi:hypothetical protein